MSGCRKRRRRLAYWALLPFVLWPWGGGAFGQSSTGDWRFLGMMRGDSVHARLGERASEIAYRRFALVRFSTKSRALYEVECSQRPKQRAVEMYTFSGDRELPMHEIAPEQFPAPWIYRESTVADPVFADLIDFVCAGVEPGRWYDLIPAPPVAVDMETLTATEGGSTIAWFRSSDDAVSEGAYVLTRREFKCKTREYRFLQLISYDADGNVSSSLDIATEWVQVVPESIGESILSAFCQLAMSQS